MPHSRRHLVVGLAGSVVLAPLVAVAQPPPKMPRVGFLIHGQRPSPEALARGMLSEALRERGWIAGENYVAEWAFTEGRLERLEELAGELVRRHVDLIWAPGGPQ